MDRQAIILHAQGVARTVVRLGFADMESTRKHFQDYLFYLNLGFEGSFSQILHARKVIDDQGLAMLQRVAPFKASQQTVMEEDNAERLGMQSMVLKLPRAEKREEEKQKAAAAAATLFYDQVIPAGSNQEAQATQFYDDVISTPGQNIRDRDAERTLIDPPTEIERPIRRIPLPRDAVPESTLPLPVFDPPPRRDHRAEGTVILPDEDLPERRQRARMDRPPNVSTSEVFHMPPGSAQESEVDLFFPELANPGRLTNKPGDSQPSFNPIASSLNAAVGPGGVLDSGLGSEIDIPSTASDDGGELDLPPSDTGDLFWKSGSGESPPPQFLEPQLGGFLGEFELVDVLGQGGMGVVFKAKRQGTQELYALKVLRVRQGVRTEARRRRFRREVEAMQRLDHTNIVKVHGYGRDGPFDWYVMEHIDGKDLSSLLKARVLDDAQKLDIFRQMCEAIIHAHENEVIHRDLKPQNVLVDPNMKVHILDFGLAKILDSDSALTHTGSALGTPFYMSPEQVADPTVVGPRTDVFALGVVLYEMVTGKRPFTGVTAGEVGNKILTVEPPPPTRVNPEIHKDLDAICLKALEKNPDRRYPSAVALHEDLVRHIKGQGVDKISPLAGARRFVEKNRSGLMMGALITLVVGAILLTLGGMIYLMFLS